MIIKSEKDYTLQYPDGSFFNQDGVIQYFTKEDAQEIADDSDFHPAVVSRTKERRFLAEVMQEISHTTGRLQNDMSYSDESTKLLEIYNTLQKRLEALEVPA